MVEEIESLPNLGPTSAAMLRKAGISTVGDLRNMGPAVAFLVVRQTGQTPSLNLLWAMAAGLRGRHWTSLSDDEKGELQAQLDDLSR